MSGNWIHRLLNPHCSDCKEEREDSLVCKSCETLKSQLDIANHDKERLLNRILAKPESEPVREPVEVTRPQNVPWNVRRQMLEREDREKAKLMNLAPKPISTEELEKELDLASETRESKR